MTLISTGGPQGDTTGMVGGISHLSGGGGSHESFRSSTGIHTVSSFGASNTTLGPPGFRARSFIESQRVKMLGRRESYFRCTHHDHKVFDFEGRMIPPGPPTSQPMLASAEQFSHYVPLKLRRPSAPYRLARVVVNSFTALLFGQGRWPLVRAHGDPATEDFAQALEREANLRTTMIRARAVGGSVGTVGLSWRYYEGKPRVQVHNGKHLCVHEWADREALVPSHVSELYTYADEAWDEDRKRFVVKWFWYRRDWTEVADILFHPIEYDRNEDPEFVIDEQRSFFHGDGICHFVWIQNLPEDEESEIDGQPDYAELYESFESIDVLKSVVVRGATLNLDPTLVLKLDPDIVARFGISKGSDNSLNVGLSGDAHYMELAGTSINAGCELVTKMRDSILEAAQCVVPDPNQVAASGTSSVALKVVHAPMLSKTDLLREQYGEGLRRLLQAMVDVARARLATTEQVPVIDEEAPPAEGEESFDEVVPYIDLPPRIDKEIETDEMTGETTEVERVIDRAPGAGGAIELDWGEYFNPTPNDRQQAVNTLQVAVAGKIMPQQSAAEEVARMFNRDRHEEWKRLLEEAEKEIDETMGMFPPIGGEVEAQGELPEGAEPPETVEVTEAPEVKLTGTDLAIILTVNEARNQSGLGKLKLPDGKEDPDGDLTVAEFKAKRIEAGEVTGEAEGQEAPPAPGAS